MHNSIVVATSIKAPQTKLIAINKNSKNENKLFDVWRLNTRLKLYGQWVEKDINN